MIRKISTSAYLPSILLMILIVIWGSSFILIKKGLDGFDPLLYIAIRMGMTGLLFLPFLILRFKRINWSLLPYIIFVGYIGALIPFTFYGIAQTKVNSSVAGMINSMTPIFTFIIGVLYFKSGFKWMQLLGIVLGFSGASILLLNESLSMDEVNIFSGLLMLLATVMYGINANVINSKLGSMHPLDLSSSSFVFASIPCWIYIILCANFEDLTADAAALTSLRYITILVVFGTFLANIIFFKLVQITNAVFGTLVAYFIPIVAVLWGLIDGEPFTYIHSCGIILILTGVYYIRKRKSHNAFNNQRT